jgi:hypothetical protein
VLPSNRVLSLREDAAGALWVRTESRELVRITDPLGEWERFGTTGAGRHVLTVHLDEPGPTEPVVWFAAEDDDQHWYRPEVVDATTVRLRRCDPTKTYVVWSPPDGDGTVVCKRGLRAPGEVRVRRRPGGEIQVHVLDVDPGRVKVVASRGTLEREGVRGEGGVFHVRGLPDGRLTIRVTADLPDGARVESERTASIGDTIDVSLVDPRRR